MKIPSLLIIDWFQEGCVDTTFSIPIVRCDPENRCAAMLVYESRLAIIPFQRQSGPDEEFDTEKEDL